MTSQNSGDEYSSLPSDTKSEADSVDGLDQSKSKVSNKPQQTSISLVPRIFIVLFGLICWESQAFLPIKRKSLLSFSDSLNSIQCVIKA